MSDSKISVVSTTRTQIWTSHIDLSLVTPSPSTTTVNSIPNSYGDSHTFSSHGYYCVVHFLSTIQYNSSFFFIFSIFFSLKMWFDVTHPDEGTSWNGQVLNVTNTVSFMTTIISTSGRLHSEFVRLLFLKAHRETDRFFASSGVPTVVSSTSATRLSLHISKAGLTWLFSLRLQFYVLLLI